MALAALAIGLFDYSRSVDTRREAIAEYARRACTDGYDQSCQGNMADIRAARAAYDTVDLGVWQLVTGLAGLVLIGWTLNATRAAVREANDATETAREAVRVTRDVGIAQTRAYLVFVEVRLRYDALASMFIGEVNIRNSGNSPAQKIRTSGTLVCAVQFPDVRDKAHSFALIASHPDIGAGQTFPLMIEFSPFARQHLDQVEAVAFSIEVSGQDVFGHPFRGIVRGMGQKGSGWLKVQPMGLYSGRTTQPSYDKKDFYTRLADPDMEDPPSTLGV